MTKAGNSQITRTITLLITIFSLSLPAYPQYSGGTGEPNDPYQIATAEDLILLGETPDDYDKHFILTADIDLDPNLPGRKVFDKAVIAPDWEATFTGTFDGKGYTISNLIINGGYNLGFFNQLDPGAIVKDLGVLNISITGRNIGGLAAQNWGQVTNCYTTGFINTSGRYARSVGGLLGNNYQGYVSDCYSTAIVNSSWGNVNAGGLVGENTGTVINCYCTGSVSSAGEHTGGLVGYNKGGIVTDSYSSALVSGTGVDSRVGGLIGYSTDFFTTAMVSYCYSTGTVTNMYQGAGGLVGTNGATLTQCWSSASVSGPLNVGGLVSSNGSGVTYCYSTGSVNGLYGNIGGLIGNNRGPVSLCYSTATVDGTDDAGGLVGEGDPDRVIRCFWDTEISGQTTSFGGTGLTTAEMKDIQTYQDARWDFVGEVEDGLHEVWQIPEEGGYPVLAILNGYSPPQLQGTGGPDDPYVISNASELGAMINYNNDSCYRLGASIDLSGIQWGVGVIQSFRGKFDGNNLTISNLNIDGSSGLFGSMSGEVKNLGVVDVNITGSGDVLGGLAAANGGIVTNCYSTGSVISDGQFVGGLVGVNVGTITNCWSTGIITGTGSVGGLAGRNDGSGIITCCYAISTVQAEWSGGGLVGANVGWAANEFQPNDLVAGVSNCYSIVLGDSRVSGLLVGENGNNNEMSPNDPGRITKCYATCSGAGMVEFFGLVGYNAYGVGEVLNSFWDVEACGLEDNGEGDTSKTTAEMQTATTFLEAGWDFVDETDNGTEDIWWIDEGNDYPRLWWEIGDEASP